MDNRVIDANKNMKAILFFHILVEWALGPISYKQTKIIHFLI